jgi:hypothetical protein
MKVLALEVQEARGSTENDGSTAESRRGGAAREEKEGRREHVISEVLNASVQLR